MQCPRDLIVLLCVVAGCGSSGGDATNDALAPDGAAQPDAASPADAPQVADGAGGPDVGPVKDASTTPVGGAMKRLVGARSHLVGSTNRACSQPVGNADRWCAFTLPSDTLGQTALWVINATKAIAGSVACTGTDPSCLRLTDDLWTGRDADGSLSHPTAHQFTGETLIFLGNIPTTSAPYEGPMYAWRPGMAAAKQLTPKGILCNAHPITDAVWCSENAQPGTFSPTVDVHAGRVGTSPLPLVATIYRHTSTNAIAWAADLSPLGDYFAWSTAGPTAADPETLYVAKIDEAAMPDKHVLVGKGISQWDLSGDEKRWFFERDYSYPPIGTGVGSRGTLVTADFPSLANEKTIAPGVDIYFSLDQPGSLRGVAYFDGTMGGTGTFKLLRDPANPASAVTVASGVIAANVSPDLRFTLIQTVDAQVGGEPVSDAIVVNNATMARCALAMNPTASTAFGSTFLPGGGLVLWADKLDPKTLSGEGWLANPDGCTGRVKFSDQVDFWLLSGNQGLLFGEPSGASKWNLRAAKLTPDGQWPPGGATTVAGDIALPFASVAPDRNYIVFEVFTGGADDGLYAYGPIGFDKP